MARRTKSGLWAAALLCTYFLSPASTASASSLFDLRDVGIDSIDNVSSFSLTVGGIKATLTALAGGITDVNTVLNRTASGFGVNAVGTGDLTDQIDDALGIESVRIVFDQP